MNGASIFIACIFFLLVIINLFTFAAYGIDKCKAKKGSWRIPEKTLILLALFGGSIGAFVGMKVFHHKTLHPKFKFGIPAILIFHILLAGVIIFLSLR